MTRFARILAFLLVSLPSSAQRASLAVTSQHSLPNSAPQALIPASAPSSATVPLIFEDNRVFVELSFRRPDGSFRKARAWVDTGGGWFAVTERVANDIGAQRKGAPFESDEQQAVDIASPAVYLGDLPLDLSSARAAAILGSDRVSPGVDAEAFLPARVLMHYQAVFDYAAKKFTLARPGTLQPQGQAVSSPIQKETGFPRIDIEIGGKPYGFLLDTGAAYTTASRDLLDQLAKDHPSWPRLTGAVGEANMVGTSDANALMVRLAKIRWGPFEIRNAGAISRRPGTFETYMSKLMTGPIVGALGGNVLRHFRVQIDYPSGITYLKQVSQPNPSGLDSLGIVFRAAADGSYFVAGVAPKDDECLQRSVRVGDLIVEVDGLKATGVTRATLIQALSGKPGDTHKLIVERGGKQLQSHCVVRHLL